MFNPNDPVQLQRLRAAMSWSVRKMAPQREFWNYARRQWVGRHCFEDGAEENVPNNMIELFVNVFTQQLSSGNPRALILTEVPGLKPIAYDHMLSVNQLLGEIDLQPSLEEWVTEALFMVGIMKVGVSEDDGMLGYYRDRNQPYAEVVLLDDYIADMKARRYDQKAFEGNRYRVPLDWARNFDGFDAEMRSRLQKTDLAYGSDESIPASERAEALSIGSSHEEVDEIDDMVELFDIYLPREKLMVTLSHQNLPRPLRVVEWMGPECGPYHQLSFNRVPGNLMPLPPIAALMDLHKIVNEAWNKLADQAQRMKMVNYFKRGAEEDAMRVLDAYDGATIGVDDPENLVKEARFGGPDQALFAMAQRSSAEFSRNAGNLDALGGLGVQADTLGQEELLKASSSGRVNFMQNKMLRATAGVVRSLAFWDWHDPLKVRYLTRMLPGVEAQVPFMSTPEQRREHDFFDFNFQIEPHSLQYQGPGQRLNMLFSSLERVVWPVLPVLLQTGMVPKFQQLFDYVGQYANLPEFRDILEAGGPMSQGGPVQPPRMGMQGMPSTTTRRYERVSRSTGPTREGQMKNMENLLLGGNGQPGDSNYANQQVG